MTIFNNYDKGSYFNNYNVKPKTPMAWIFALLFVAISIGNVNAQLSVTTEGSPYTIDFDNTVSGVNNGQFNGSGFAPSPTAGQINSNAFAIIGMSEGDLNFGDTETSGDLARGTSPGKVATGGVYAFEVSPSDYVLGFQAGGDDMTPGDIILKITNNTGGDIGTVDLSYEIWQFNDQHRSTSMNLSYSTDNSSYVNIPSLNFTSVQAATAPNPPIPPGPIWVKTDRSFSIDLVGTPLADGEDLFLRWTTDDVGGSGSRDELAIDDIKITMNVPPMPDVDSEVLSIGGLQPDAIDVSSLYDVEPEAAEVFWFQISDYGTLDGLSTKVQSVRLVPGANNDVSWASQIQGIRIDDFAGNFYSFQSIDITDTYIDISFVENEINVPDGTDAYFRAWVYLNTSNIVDGASMDFQIDTDAAGFSAYASGSSFAPTFPAAITSNTHTIIVEATELSFVQQPINSNSNIAMATDVSVETIDINGNRDLDFSDNVLLSSSGTMTGDPISVAAVAGIATWSEAIDPVVHTVGGTELYLTASSAGLNDGVSDPFDILQTADRVEFTSQPINGISNQVVDQIVVSALEPDLSVSTSFVGDITISKEEGPGNISGTLTKPAIAGVATFDDIVFDADGDYTLRASGEPFMAEDISDPIEIGSFIEDFASCPPSGWLTVGIKGNTWACGNGYAAVSGLGGTSPSQSWYVSPSMDFSAFSDAVLYFQTWTGGTDSSHPKLEVLYSNDYIGIGNPNVFTWIPLEFNLPAENSQTWVSSGSIDLSGIIGTGYIAFKYQSTGTSDGSATEWRIDNITVSEAGCTAPIVSSSNLIISDIAEDEMTLNWDGGNGTGRIVIAKEGSAVTETPVNYEDYMANSVYGTEGTEIGSSFVVYKGNGNSMTLTGLTKDTQYYFSIFEFNCDDDNPTFNISTSLVGNAKTIEPLASDIIAEESYVYNTNIDYVPYAGFQNLTTSNTLDVFKMAIRDEGFTDVGGVSDGNGTELTSITFSTNGSTAIKGAAIFKGELRIDETAVNGATSFTFDDFENTLIAPSDDSIHFTLRVTFADRVTDNNQLVFTISEVIANPTTSLFALPNGGGAQSINTNGDENKIRVVGTELIFSPRLYYSIPVNEELYIGVGAKDSRNSLDKDKILTISKISGTGTLTSATGLSRSTASSKAYAYWSDLIYDTEEDTEFEITDGGAIPLTITTGVLKAKQRFNIFTFESLQGDEVTAAPDFQPEHLTVSDISRGANIVPQLQPNTFSARSWDLEEDPDSYFEISITPDPGFSFSISSMEIDNKRTGSGPDSWRLTSSLDGYVNTIGSPFVGTPPTIWVRNSDIEFGSTAQNLTETITLRIFASGATNGNANFSLDNIEIFGTVTDIAPPDFSVGFPQYDSTSVAGFDLLVNTTEPVSVYYIAQDPSVSAPTLDQVITGKNGEDLAAEGSGMIDVTKADSTFTARFSTLGLMPLYDVYFVLDDGTYQSNVILQEDVPISDINTELSEALQPTTTSISSMSNDVENATAVLSFKINDLGTSDGSPTYISKLNFVAGSNNTVTDWQSVIAGAVIYNNTIMDSIPIMATTVGTNSLELDFSFGDFNIIDGTSQEITLSVWLTNTVTDHEVLEIEIGGISHGNTTSNFGSQFNNTLTSLTSNALPIDVEADSLYFASIPINIFGDEEEFPVTVHAVDKNGNLDLDEEQTVVLSRGIGSGIISSATGLTVTMENGVASWTDLKYDGPDDGGEVFNLVANDNAAILSQTTSETIQFIDGDDLIVTSGNTIVVTHTRSFTNVTIELGGKLILSLGDSLKINGDFTIDGVFDDKGGTVSFNGNNGQTIQSNIADKTVKFYNIDISNINVDGVINEINIDLINTLKLNEGVTFDADGSADGRNFTLISSPTATARIAAVEEGATLSGEVVWQRSLRTGPQGWRYVGTPIKGQTVAEWIDDVYIQGIEGQPNAEYQTNFATYIESLGTTGQNGFDGWKKYNYTSDPIIVGVGNKLWEWNNKYNPTLTIINKGLPTIGDGINNVISGTENITFPVSFEPTSLDGGGWNFYANPYPSELDWDSPDFVHSGIEGGAVYIWNPEMAQYGTYDGSEGVNGVSQYIASGQGFFVKAMSGAATISVNEQAKSSGNGNSFLRKDNDYASIKLKISSDSHFDETVVTFKDYTTDGHDPEYDARKLAGGYVNFSSKLDNNLLMAINSMGSLRGVKKVKLNMDLYDYGDYHLTIPKIKDIEEGTLIRLVDNYMNKSVVVNTTTDYKFKVDKNINESYGSDRFELQFATPVKFSLGEVQAKSGQEFVVPVYANQFADITKTQLALGWDTEVLEFIGVEELNITNLSGFDLSKVADGEILLNDTKTTPIDYPDGDQLFAIRFKAKSGQLEANLRFEKDKMGITAINDIDMPFSTKDAIINILQNRMVAGKVATYTDEPVNKVQIKAEGDDLLTQLTDESGSFTLDAFEQSSYKLSATKNDIDYVGDAVTVLDIIKTRRHLLQTNSFESPYQSVAADVNGSRSITALDLAMMRKVVLGINDGFENGVNWMFIPEVNDLSNDPFAYDTNLDMAISDQDVNLNFVAVKIGDVDNSWTSLSSGRKSSSKMKLEFAPASLVDDVIEIPVKASDFHEISGYQFSVSWDATQFLFESIDHNTIHGEYNDQYIEIGILSTVWDEGHGKSMDLEDGEILFTLRFRAKGEKADGSISINSEMTKAIAFDRTLDWMEISPVSAKVNIEELRNGTMELFQNKPNPFNASTEIGFKITHKGLARLTVVNMLGETVYVHEQNYSPGVYSINWDKRQGVRSLTSGVYLYKLESNGKELVKKMIIR